MSILLPFLFCTYGLVFTFFPFLKAADAISGDFGDARFNASLLEHSWIWLTHPFTALFNLPIFYPHANAFAYSDYLLGLSPLYGASRVLGGDVLFSFQVTLILCSLLNFGSVFAFTRKFFSLDAFWASFAAYLFAFALPRTSHFEHAQLVPQFFIVMAAAGAMWMWKKPASHLGPILFFAGSALQFLTAFYYFWFWIWTIAVFIVAIAIQKNHRLAQKIYVVEWKLRAPKRTYLIAMIVSLALLFPFLIHYAGAASEIGMRPWVPISATVPRLYSWIKLPTDHWQYAWLPLRSWVEALPMGEEHELSFGLFTWVGLTAAAVHAFRTKAQRWIWYPIAAMFLFTLTSGRVSDWALMTYLFPGGRAIRAVGRIQVFMLLAWAPAYAIYFQTTWKNGKRYSRAWVAFLVVAFFAENSYVTTRVFSKSESNGRVAALTQKIPPLCQAFLDTDALHEHDDFKHMDDVLAALQNRVFTVNGYSGNTPKHYDEIFFLSPNQTPAERLNAWLDLHPGKIEKMICSI